MPLENSMEGLSYAATRSERLKNIGAAIAVISTIEERIKDDPWVWVKGRAGELQDGNIFAGCMAGHIAHVIKPLGQEETYRTTVSCQQIIDADPIGGLVHDAVEYGISGEAHGYWNVILSWNDRETTLVQDVLNVLVKARMYLGNILHGAE